MAIPSFRALAFEGARVAAIMGFGDVICQTYVDKRELKNVDLGRTVRFASVGLFYIGPVLKIWYGQLDKIVSPKNPPLKRGIKKVALDQLLFAPVLVGSLIGIIGLVNGESVPAVKDRIKNDYFSILAKNYMIWPPAQLINFSVVPVQYQVLFAQFIALIWNTVLSMAMNEKK